jgi:hypothetical protein
MVSLRAWERHLVSEAAEMKQRADEIKRLTKREGAAVFDVRYCWHHDRRKDAKLQEMMRQCTSRDDFIVREGPRIAWSELASAEPSFNALGFYLPAGEHRLHLTFVERGRFVDGRRSANCQLGPQAEVYEIQIRPDGSGGLIRLIIVGQENAIIHEEKLTGSDGRGDVRLIAGGSGLAYPSELAFQEKPSWSPKPKTELACLQIDQPERAEPWQLRVRIESAAPPCVSAVEATAHHDRQTQSFAQNFQPYDGSGRLYFRDGVISSLSPSPRE